MPNYLLQWEMIKWAKESGCTLYDFRGISGDLDPSNPLYGLYRFKKGFNGSYTEFIGEFDLVFDALMYKLWDKGLPLVKKLRSKIMMAGKSRGRRENIG
jgi:lipid II:glycine glycyltransferase (peptidoglycan interpeptide bridge formation enzyme)